MKIILKLFVSFIIYLLVNSCSYAQSNSGTEFWLAFTKIPWDRENHVIIYISSNSNAKGSVEIPSMSYFKRFACRPDELITIELPRKILIDSNERITNKSVHIQSDQPITVVGLNNQKFGTDGFLALPNNSLGKDYFAICYPGTFPSHYLVVATEDNTEITMNPSAELVDNVKTPIVLKLNKGQTYLALSKPGLDLTGSSIKSSKRIALYSGNLGCFIPDSSYCCANHLVEQIPDIKMWGKEFITVPLAQKSIGDFYKIVSAHDGNEISINDTFKITLDKGQYFETMLPSKKKSFIICEKATLVAQFSTSFQYDSASFTDPFMVILTPSERYLPMYDFIVPAMNFDSNNFINIHAKSIDLNDLRIDDMVVDSSIGLFSRDSSGYHSFFVRPGAHKVFNIKGDPFGLSIYGYNNFDGYGYNGGMSLTEISCNISKDERFSFGASVSYPFGYGGQIEFGMNNYNLAIGFLYSPRVGVLDGTPPPEWLNRDNFQYNIFISPAYYLPLNCKAALFGGPYFALGFRKWKNLPEIIGEPPEVIGIQSGSFIEYYFGLQAGLKYALTNNLILGFAGSISMQTVHKFVDEKISGLKLVGGAVLSLSYLF